MVTRAIRLRRQLTLLAVVTALVGGGLAAVPAAAQTGLLVPEGTPHVLIYSATYGFRHAAIPKGNALMMAAGAGTGAYSADYSENPADLSAENLAKYDAVVFHSTAGKAPTMTDEIRDGFIRFMACGGGFVGLAMAADSNYAWPEYAELLGGNIVNHTLGENHTPATRVYVSDPDHPINQTFADSGMTDLMTQEELYTFRMDPRRLPTVRPLLSFDVTTMTPSVQEGPDFYYENAPVAWTSIFRGRGRSVYNGFGHGDLSWDQAWFREMTHDSIKWVLGPTGHPVDRECAAGEGDLQPPASPTPIDYEDQGVPCALPPETGLDRGHYRDNLEVLTKDGVSNATMLFGTPAYIFAPNMRYLLDLSDVGSPSADLELTMTWGGVADFDLGITTPWGFAGSHRTPGQDMEVSSEHVVLQDVPHCTDFLVAAEHLASTSYVPGFEPMLTITVTPNPPLPAPPAED